MENYYFKHSSHFGDMFGNFEEFFRSSAMADVIIACDGKTIHAHKIVLSAGSDYFRNVLISIKQQSHFPVLFINDIAYEDMETILEFIYRGQIVVTRDKVESLRQAAYKLRVKGFENFLRKPFIANGLAMGNQLKVSNGTMRNISMLSHENNKRVMQQNVMRDPNEMKRMKMNNGLNMKIPFDHPSRANGIVFNRFKEEARRIPNGLSVLNGLSKNFHSTPNGIASKRAQIEQFLKRPNPIVPRAQPEMPKINIDMNELKMKLEPESRQVCITPVQHETPSPKGDVPVGDSCDENEDNHRNENTENSGIIENTSREKEALNLVNSRQSVNSTPNQECESDDNDANEENYTYEMDPTALNWDSYNDENVPENQEESEGYDDEEDYFETVNRNGHSIEALMNQANLMKLNGQLGQGQFYYCDHCPKYFFDVDHLQLHIKRSHGLNKLNQCNICGKTYAWKSGLYKHKRHVHNISGKSLSQLSDNVMEPPSPVSPQMQQPVSMIKQELEQQQSMNLIKQELEQHSGIKAQ